MSEAHEPKITSLKDLKQYAEGNVVELPPFAEGQPFVARLRRPSLLALAKQGKIPNELLSAAMEMFQGKQEVEADSSSLRQMYDIVTLLCDASLVEPTFKELEEAGVTLTDEQMIAIFQYSQRGVQALKPFRK